MKKQTISMANTNKKQNEILIKFKQWNNRIPEIYYNWVIGENFVQSSFLIERVVSYNVNSLTVKKK